jgi:hypothetical protein
MSENGMGCSLAASYSEGRATPVAGNNSAKPTSSMNAPARLMLRIGRLPQDVRVLQ